MDTPATLKTRVKREYLSWEQGDIRNIVADEFVPNGDEQTTITIVNATGAVDKIIVWANHDILNTDGGVYFAGSNPVETTVNVEPAPIEPDYYSFNGTVLPRIPTPDEMKTEGKWPNGVSAWDAGWDIVKIPYVAVCQSTAEPNRFWLLVNLHGGFVADNNGLIGSISRTNNYLYDVLFELIDGKWVGTYNGYLQPDMFVSGGPVIWANHDIYHFDADNNYQITENLYLNATEPVPVNEE